MGSPWEKKVYVTLLINLLHEFMVEDFADITEERGQILKGILLTEYKEYHSH
jgi:hypothetical protein